MERRVIEILSSFDNAYETCAIGNIAVARGAIEAGVNGVFSYPGTPSTEISEVFSEIDKYQLNEQNKVKHPEFFRQKIYFEYSVNEKVALEKAIAFSIGNKAAMCVMKNVGMNVASDALMSITYQTIIGPLVILVCDDPGCYSSSNEQDSRYWGQMASVPVFNPATPAEALEMTREAFKLSESLKLPVIVRMTTRVSHTRGNLIYGKRNEQIRTASFQRMPEHINIPARTASAHQKLILKLQNELFKDYFERFNVLRQNRSKNDIAIIASGVTAAYTSELLHSNQLEAEIDVMYLGLFWPFPKKQLSKFLNHGYSRILVLEELDPIIEKEIKVLAQELALPVEIYGKGFESLKASGEYNLELVAKTIAAFSGLSIIEAEYKPLPDMDTLMGGLPPRPPALCSGCPHRATFYALKLAVPRYQSEMVLCGDIGCFGLGALPPLQMIDTINHMGMSVSMAQGLSAAFSHSNNAQKVIALVGDSTFFHSGIPSLMNAIYTRSNILLVVFDNRTTGMTGHQDNPGASKNPKHNQLDVEQLVKGLGVEMVTTISPFELKDSFRKIETAMQYDGVSVIVSKAPCIFLPDFASAMPEQFRIEVDPGRCNSCANHQDMDIACSRCGSALGNLSRAKAKLSAGHAVAGSEQLCPANICNHGFFHSILEGDYKSAVEVVRDKMLFARSCGDICHRPCELFSSAPAEDTVPIKQLKKYVSGIEENFIDFSAPRKRIEKAKIKGKNIAIVGAGPAGLSAAYDLLQQGYEVSIYEKGNAPGGMIKNAIPNFRMDKKGFDFEAGQIEKLGAKMHYAKALGEQIHLSQLQSDYDAVILAIGLGKSKYLDIISENIPADQQFDALSFLYQYNNHKLKTKAGSRFLIIGGGNSAMDAARTAKKLDPANEVNISCIESFDDMPAFREEIEHAMNEGIQLIPNSFIESCKTRDQALEFDLFTFDSKKPLQKLQADYIIMAIGQLGDKEALAALNPECFDEQGRIKMKKLEQSAQNIFVAGDLYAGNHMSIIGAIASGKKAAVDVRKLLETYHFDYEGKEALERLNTKQPENQVAFTMSDQEILKNIENFDLYQSCAKCNHCIENFGCPALVMENGQVHVEQAICTKCGLCVDVCPNDAIQWVTVKESAGKII